MQDDSGIGWLAIPHRRLKANLFGSLDCVVIKAVTESANHPQHTEAPGGLQNNFQKNFTLNPEIPSFLSIEGRWLGKNFRGHGFRNRFGRARMHGGRCRNISIPEAAGLNGAGGRPVDRRSGAIAKAGTSYDSRDTLGVAGAIAGAGP